MSDNWITLVPEDPRYVPSRRVQLLARKRLAEIAPKADEIELKNPGTIQFFDAGANFERVLCPACQAEIPIEWWQDRMDDDFDRAAGFSLHSYKTPCCGASLTLRNLVYQWPQSFGSFAIEAMNPNIRKLRVTHQRELEKILGTKLTVIYQHL